MSTMEETTPAASRVNNPDFEDVDTTEEFGDQLRAETTAVRVRRSSLGTSRKLAGAQVAQSAETFGAAPEFISARKKLFDTKHESYKRVTAIVSSAFLYWRSVTVPFPDRGIRLLRRDRVETFERQMNEFVDDLMEAVDELNKVYQSEILPNARVQLGDLYDPSDYPQNLNGCWSIDWEFPSVEPPDYLRELNPRLWEQERQRATDRFNEAVRLTEVAMAEELAKAIEAIVERLTPQEVNAYTYAGDSKLIVDNRTQNLTDELTRLNQEVEQDGLDGNYNSELDRQVDEVEAELIRLGELAELAVAEKIERVGSRIRFKFPKGTDANRRSINFDSAGDAAQYLSERSCEWARAFTENKTFHSSSVDNLQEFFGRFTDLSIGSNEELDNLVSQAQQAVEGVDVKTLREGTDESRAAIREPLAAISGHLEGMLVDRPNRAIDLDGDE